MYMSVCLCGVYMYDEMCVCQYDVYIIQLVMYTLYCVYCIHVFILCTYKLTIYYSRLCVHSTGDIQLTLSQIMNITAAIIITTPQRLSFVDVVKGIDLYDTVNVPCIAVVENMSEYISYNFTTLFYNNLYEQINSLYTASILLNSGSDVTSGVTSQSEDSLGVFRSETIEKTSKSVIKIIEESIEKQKQPLKLFGNGYINRLKDMWGIDNMITLPLLSSLSQAR